MNQRMERAILPAVGLVVLWMSILTWKVLTPNATLSKRAEQNHGLVVAFVHGDSLQRGMQLVQSMKANLQMQLSDREAQLQSDALPLQEEAQELLAYANGGQATDEELNIAQRRILEIENALRQLQNAAEQDMMVAEQNMQAVMAEALRRHLEAHAEAEGIDYILNWGLSGEGVLFGAPGWDITEEVLERINDAHPFSIPVSSEDGPSNPEDQ